jgi:hypothetical protein
MTSFISVWRIQSLLREECWRAFSILADARGGRFVIREQP